jgi:hypothetical protein
MPHAVLHAPTNAYPSFVTTAMPPRMTIAFSSQVDTDSHSNQVYADCVYLSAVENASKQKIEPRF